MYLVKKNIIIVNNIKKVTAPVPEPRSQIQLNWLQENVLPQYHIGHTLDEQSVGTAT